MGPSRLREMKYLPEIWKLLTKDQLIKNETMNETCTYKPHANLISTDRRAWENCVEMHA